MAGIAEFEKKGGNITNAVVFWVYKSKNATDYEIPKKNGSIEKAACFGPLSYNGVPEDVNRICYDLNTNMKDDEKQNWLKFCLECKLLPGMIKDQLNSKKYVLDTDAIKPLLYVYLCNLRSMAEDPDLCRATMILANEEKMHPYAALFFAHNYCIVNTGHHYLPLVSDRGWGGKKITQTRINFIQIRGFCEFMLDPQKYAQDKCRKLIATASINKAILDIKFSDKLRELCHFNYLDYCDPLVVKALNVKSLEKSEELVISYVQKKEKEKKK